MDDLFQNMRLLLVAHENLKMNFAALEKQNQLLRTENEQLNQQIQLIQAERKIDTQLDFQFYVKQNEELLKMLVKKPSREVNQMMQQEEQFGNSPCLTLSPDPVVLMKESNAEQKSIKFGNDIALSQLHKNSPKEQSQIMAPMQVTQHPAASQNQQQESQSQSQMVGSAFASSKSVSIAQSNTFAMNSTVSQPQAQQSVFSTQSQIQSQSQPKTNVFSFNGTQSLNQSKTTQPPNTFQSENNDFTQTIKPLMTSTAKPMDQTTFAFNTQVNQSNINPINQTNVVQSQFQMNQSAKPLENTKTFSFANNTIKQTRVDESPFKNSQKLTVDSLNDLRQTKESSTVQSQLAVTKQMDITKSLQVAETQAQMEYEEEFEEEQEHYQQEHSEHQEHQEHQQEQEEEGYQEEFQEEEYQEEYQEAVDEDQNNYYGYQQETNQNDYQDQGYQQDQQENYGDVIDLSDDEDNGLM
ncbi:Hypothetical_protein [Hexamita inflata]|uniref:Hypothetical_protein n=1 Tax=Hexamita inflata TaxID=28002 RepID=A0AA86QDR9_9EUKA|nr:Hypothetical protein HINF_LOCUS43813 [Hexamita inflata]